MRSVRHGSTGLGLAIAFLAQSLTSSASRACGVSTADGLSACSLQEHEEATRPRWHAGASGVYTSTAIRFTGGLRSEETRSAVVAALGYQPWPRTTLQLAVGSTLGGQLTTPAGRYDFSPGPTAAIGASWRLGSGKRPFVVLTSNLAFSAATTQPSPTAGAGAGDSVGYYALDLRVGVVVGVTILRVASPYAVGRGFGGPVFWQYQGVDVTGGDVHHYQLGGGLTVLIADRVNIFAEAIPLGERSAAGGAAVAF